MIQLECPHCSRMLQIPDQYAGTRGHCNFCGGLLVVRVDNVFQNPKRVWETSSCGSFLQRSERLLTVAEEGNLDEVAALLEQGCSVNKTDRRGLTALHLASRAGYVQVARLLVAAHALVGATSPDGCTPLHWAAAKGHFLIVRLLLDHGADVSARDKEGKTPLHLAARSVSKDRESMLEVVNLLLKAGAHVDSRDNRNVTPLMEAAELGFPEVAEFLRQRMGPRGV